MSDQTCAADDIWTVGRLLEWTTKFLAESRLDEPRLAAELLLAHALDCRKIELYTRFDHRPDDGQRVGFRELIQKAAQGAPVAHLIGRKEFYSLTFEVTPDVLIPRPETEALVEQAVVFCRARSSPVHLLDLGTGSGCVAVAILTQSNDTRAVASDISQAALEVAARNVQRHGLSDRLALICADGLAIPADVVPAGGFDLLVSNPPYVRENEGALLSSSVRDYEPHGALFGGPDGLTFYRMVQQGAAPLLKPDGLMLVEIGAGMKDAVIEMMTTGGAFGHAGTWRDAADPHDRVLGFTRLESGGGA